jgi:AraC-like DNA-binding protein
MERIIFDSAKLAGDAHLRAEQWIETLASGYVRLSADPAPGDHFKGRLRIAKLAGCAIGTLGATVQSITRTRADVAIENTDNVVLLFNQGSHVIGIEQEDKSTECIPGAAVLIEQCEPSTIRVGASSACCIAAIQVPRDQVRCECPKLPERFLVPILAPSSASLLTRAYIDFLLDTPDRNEPSVARFASSHACGLIAAIVNSDGMIREEPLDGLHAGRTALVLREIDRYFAHPSFSLTMLARRIGVTPRHVQALLAGLETSFTDELTRRRLDCARDMLTSPHQAHKSILEISGECGFSTVSHFHRTFRRNFGVTPGELRASVRR